jgi:hypothetical protein
VKGKESRERLCGKLTPKTRRWSRKLANKDFVLLPDFSSVPPKKIEEGD